MELSILVLIYISAAVTFIVGLKMMSNPSTARKGNIIAGIGMLFAIFATIFLFRDEDGNKPGNHLWIFAGLAIGTVVGVLMAKK